MCAVRRLVLFDIDGTLLTTNGAARRAFEAALMELFGTVSRAEGHSFAGKTDPQIARELLGTAGIPEHEIDDSFPRLWRRYLLHLADELEAHRPQVYPGVVEILDRVAEAGSGLVPGLLTGNIEPGARAKVDAAGLDFDRFPVGAFGSDHADRGRLPRVAVERAARRTGETFEPGEVVIVGDTPADVACGKGFGARTVAVATGSYGREQLAACAPAHLLDDLSHLEAVLEVLLG